MVTQHSIQGEQQYNTVYFICNYFVKDEITFFLRATYPARPSEQLEINRLQGSASSLWLLSKCSRSINLWQWHTTKSHGAQSCLRSKTYVPTECEGSGLWRLWDRASLEQRCKQPTRCNDCRLLIILLIYLNLLYMLRATNSPIFWSTFDCIYSFGTTHRYRCRSAEISVHCTKSCIYS